MVVCLADDDAHGHGGLAMLIPGSQDELGDVDDDWRGLELGRHPTPTLQRPFDLPHAIAEGNVEGAKRSLADHAVRLKAMPVLKALYGHDKSFIVDLVAGLVRRREIADAAEHPCQLRKRGIALSGFEHFHHRQRFLGRGVGG